jgi:hypothetical protein
LPEMFVSFGGRTNAWTVNLIQPPHTVCAPLAANRSKGLRRPLWLGAKEISFSATNFAPRDSYLWLKVLCRQNRTPLTEHAASTVHSARSLQTLFEGSARPTVT